MHQIQPQRVTFAVRTQYPIFVAHRGSTTDNLGSSHVRKRIKKQSSTSSCSAGMLEHVLHRTSVFEEDESESVESLRRLDDVSSAPSSSTLTPFMEVTWVSKNTKPTEQRKSRDLYLEPTPIRYPTPTPSDLREASVAMDNSHEPCRHLDSPNPGV